MDDGQSDHCGGNVLGIKVAMARGDPGASSHF